MTLSVVFICLKSIYCELRWKNHCELPVVSGGGRTPSEGNTTWRDAGAARGGEHAAAAVSASTLNVFCRVIVANLPLSTTMARNEKQLRIRGSRAPAIALSPLRRRPQGAQWRGGAAAVEDRNKLS